MRFFSKAVLISIPKVVILQDKNTKNHQRHKMFLVTQQNFFINEYNVLNEEMHISQLVSMA